MVRRRRDAPLCSDDFVAEVLDSEAEAMAAGVGGSVMTEREKAKGLGQ